MDHFEIELQSTISQRKVGIELGGCDWNHSDYGQILILCKMTNCNIKVQSWVCLYLPQLFRLYQAVHCEEFCF